MHYVNAILILLRYSGYTMVYIIFQGKWPKLQGDIKKDSYKRSSVVNTGEEKSNTEADALRFEDLNWPCFQNATEVIAVDSHTSCDRHNAIHCFYTWMTWLLHSLSSLNLFKSWQFMLYYSTLLVLIIRLKSFLHEINWNFKKSKQGLLFSKQLKFFWLGDWQTNYKSRGAMQKTKPSSIYNLKCSDERDQGRERVVKCCTLPNTLWCEIRSAGRRLPFRYSAWFIAFCQNLVTAILVFYF